MDIFRGISVRFAPGIGYEIMWDLMPTFKAPGPYNYAIERRLSGGAWETVSYITGVQVIYDAASSSHPAQAITYKITLVDANNNHYTSKEFSTTRFDKNALIAREIARKERLEIEKLSGRPGYIYKRRFSGDKCTECRSPDTGVVVNANCLACYGTGYTPGYSLAEVMFVKFTPSAPKKNAIEETGNRIGVVVGARAPGPSFIQPQDLWRDHYSGKIYNIATVKDNSFRGVTFSHDLELREVPESDIVYNLKTQLYRIVNGSLYILDIQTLELHPVGLYGGAFSILDGPTTFQSLSNTLYLYDVEVGDYYAVAIDDNSFVVLGDSADNLLKVDPTNIYLKDIQDNVYKAITIRNSVLEIGTEWIDDSVMNITGNKYKLINGSLHLYDIATGTWNPVGLDNNSQITLEGDAMNLLKIEGGQLKLYDIATGIYEPVALSNGQFVVLNT